MVEHQKLATSQLFSTRHLQTNHIFIKYSLQRTHYYALQTYFTYIYIVANI